MNYRYSNDCFPFCKIYSNFKILQNGKCLIKGKCHEKKYAHSISGLLSGCDQILLTILSDIFQNFYALQPLK